MCTTELIPNHCLRQVRKSHVKDREREEEGEGGEGKGKERLDVVHVFVHGGEGKVL